MICPKCGEFIRLGSQSTRRYGECFDPTLGKTDHVNGLWCEDCFEEFLTDCQEEAVACQECGTIEDWMYEDEMDGEVIILCPDCAWKKGKVYLLNLSYDERWEGYEE